MLRNSVEIAGTWGMAGKLAVAFAELLGDWKRAQAQGISAVAPRAFKRIIGDYHALGAEGQGLF